MSELQVGTSTPHGNLTSQHGRTDARTHEDSNYDCDILSLTATRAHVQAIDVDVVSFGDVLAAGFMPTSERFPVTRKGEREPIPYYVRAAVWLRDNGVCQKCKKRNPKPWELDHIIPWSSGGPDTSENLRVLCEKCNRDRSNYDDRTAFAKRPVTWWCHRCYVDPVQWDYDHPGSVYCPTHWHGGDERSPRCAVERIYRWQRDSGETPTWHKRAPIEALVHNAYCAHCGVPGLTDVTL